MATYSVRKIWGALSDVRKRASLNARILLTGDPAVANEVRELLVRDATPAGVAAVDALDVAQFPTKPLGLQGYSVVVFLEDGLSPARPDLKAQVSFCEAVGLRVIVAVVRDTPAVPVDRQYWLSTLGIGPKHFVVHTRGGDAATAPLARRLAASVGHADVALAAALPAVRPAVLDHLIDAAARQNAAVGVLIFIPGADMPVMTLNQIRMVLHIGAAHGYDPTPQRVLEILSVIASGLGLRAVARYAIEFVPGLGWALKGAVGYTGTQAIGRSAVLYFESGAAMTPGRMRRVTERVGKIGSVGKGLLRRGPGTA